MENENGNVEASQNVNQDAVSETQNSVDNTQTQSQNQSIPLSALNGRIKQAEKSIMNKINDVLKANGIDFEIKLNDERQAPDGEKIKLNKRQENKVDHEKESLRQQLEETKIDNRLIGAIAKHRLNESVNPAHLQMLIKASGQIKSENGRVIVLDEYGDEAFDEQGKPMSIDTFVSAWLAQNKIYTAPSPIAGSGTRPVNGKTSLPHNYKDASVYNNLPLDQKKLVWEQELGSQRNVQNDPFARPPREIKK